VIERERFDSIMADLAEVFVPLTDQGMNIYFRYLQSESETVLRRAVHWLLENHNAKRFPFLAEITDSCSDIKKAMGGNEAPVPGFRDTVVSAFCECNGTGFLLKDHLWPDGVTTVVARYCACEVGSRIKAAHEKYFAWRRRRSESWESRRNDGPPSDFRAEAAHDYADSPDERGKRLEENRDGFWERSKNNE